MPDVAERDDAATVWSWRFGQALELGLTDADACRFADSDGDTETLRRLVRAGCDPHVAVRILT